MGTIIYYLDAIFRLVIVVGLKLGNISVQLCGIFGAITMSSLFQTTMLILIPIYRWNTAGTQICDESESQHALMDR